MWRLSADSLAARPLLPAATNGLRRAPDRSLEASLAYCRALLNAKAKSFAFASRFLPTERRRATQALYAFFRTVDDVADTCARPGDPAALAALADWQRWVEAGCPADGRHPVRAAAAWAVRRYALRAEPLLELIDGVRGDLWPRRLASETEYDRYCYQVAGTVGLTMAQVLGTTNSAAPALAARLGIAMQMTNIIRDVGEDLRRGRIYLPADAMAAAGCSYELLRTERIEAPLVRVLQQLIARARAAYRQAEGGIALLPAETQLPIRLAARLYEGILGKVERNGYDVFRKRAHLGRTEKVRFAAALAWKSRR